MASEKNAEINVTARTVEEAIEQGMAELGLKREEIEVEVVSTGRSGLLGIGAQEAHVRIRQVFGTGETSHANGLLVQEPEIAGVDETSVLTDVELEPAAEREVTRETQASPEELVAQGLLQGLIDRMGIRGKVVVEPGDDLADEDTPPPIVLDVTGNDLGILIGRQGETLQALQYITRLMLSKQLNRWEPVVVDVESYRARRRSSLRRLALRMAERVASGRRRVVLEAMPAYERRIVHLALHDHPNVTTKSVGEGSHRKVTIIPK